MDTGFPIVVWRVCLGLGFAVDPPFLAWVGVVCGFLAPLRLSWPGSVVCARGYGFCLFLASPGWVPWCARLGTGWWWACVSMGSSSAPPVLAGACSPCVGMGLDVTSPALAGFVARAFGCGSSPYPAIPGLGSWRVFRCGCCPQSASRGWAAVIGGGGSVAVPGGAFVGVVLRPPWLWVGVG